MTLFSKLRTSPQFATEIVTHPFLSSEKTPVHPFKTPEYILSNTIRADYFNISFDRVRLISPG